MTGICEKGRCRNTNGGFTCVCQPGYQLTDDGRNCRGKWGSLVTPISLQRMAGTVGVSGGSLVTPISLQRMAGTVGVSGAV